MALKSHTEVLEELQTAMIASAHAQEYLVRGRSNRKAQFKDLFNAYLKTRQIVDSEGRGSMFVQAVCQPVV